MGLSESYLELHEGKEPQLSFEGKMTKVDKHTPVLALKTFTGNSKLYNGEDVESEIVKGREGKIILVDKDVITVSWSFHAGHRIRH